MIDFKRIFLDTSPIIYYIEGNEEYFDIVGRLFREHIDSELFTSTITIAEFLTKPYRDNRLEYVDAFYGLIDKMDICVAEISDVIADKAAQIRAKYDGFKMMDSIQLAVASIMECDMFLTNDKQLKRFSEVNVAVIGDL